MGKAEILARSIIKNGPITNSKRRATDIEKGPVFAKPLLSELGHPQRGLGQSSIFYSDDDATDPAFKAARQVGYSGNGFG
jgi:hypothetical protein